MERKPNRLRGYDYSTPGAYFVTICVHDRFKNRNIFGEIRQGSMIGNRRADIVEACWRELPNHFPEITLDEFAVMPDHFHGIVHITPHVPHVGNRHACSLPTCSLPARQHAILPQAIGSFKSAVSKNIHNSNFPISNGRNHIMTTSSGMTIFSLKSANT